MANDPKYTAATARADKLLEPDGSVKTASGTVVSGPSAAGAAMYSAAVARADKLLEPDGSITTSGSGTGGSTPPGGTTGQIQYNNAGVFAGANITTDATNLIMPNGSQIYDSQGASVVYGGQVLTLQCGGSGQVVVKPGGTNVAGVFNTTNGFATGYSGSLVTNAANGANLDVQSPPATNTTNYPSGTQHFTGHFWNASAASQDDYWTVQNVVGAGATPTSLLSFSHTGSSNADACLAINPGQSSGPGIQFFSQNYGIGMDGGDLVLYAVGSQGISLKAAGSPSPPVGGTVVLRAVSAGKVGIMTTSPTSVLHVVGLPVYANNAAATAGGLTAGAFYRTGSDPDTVCVVH